MHEEVFSEKVEREKREREQEMSTPFRAGPIRKYSNKVYIYI